MGAVVPSLVSRLAYIVITFACALQLAIAEPVAEAAAEPEAAPDALPQGSVYQFSGAVYILGGNGGWCPAEAPQGCGGIPWCCASGCSCQQLNNGVVGCCPYGGTCQGTVAAAAISTVTVYQSYPVTTTVTQGGGTTVVVAGQPGPVSTTSTTTAAVVAAGATTTTTTRHSSVVTGGNYCSTLYAKGPNLPTTAAGECGTILVVNSADALVNDVWRIIQALGVTWAATACLALFR